ncbi:hypothetical protein [uncultured Flavobacterium sp.]|uniref:hypothetical protein n=1 Tax=uncultured Flavobacterium sp. TaxID=165435 RepID=UPI0025DEF924|nr:hypothetical protein [uncultured Flavobacterium sp.]
MKKRNARSIFQKTAIVLFTMLLGAFASCSSDDGGDAGNSGGEGKNVKLTITINGVVPDDYLSFVAVGSALSSPGESTIWKVNGTTHTNESAVSFGKNDFTGSTKTYVVESIAPLRLAQVGMQFLATGDRSYTFSYKAEINGQVVKEENNVVVTATADYTHDYTY